MRIAAAILCSTALLAGPAAAQSEAWLASKSLGRSVCTIQSVWINEAGMLITCDKPNTEGFDQFVQQRDYRRFNDVKDMVEVAVTNGQPVLILWTKAPTRGLDECEVDHCRQIWALGPAPAGARP